MGDNAKALADCKKVTELDATLIYGHFNLACFYSLQGMLPESLAAMETAMQAGYRKFDKIDTDSDLENVRRKPEFAKLVEKYKAQTPKLDGSRRSFERPPPRKGRRCWPMPPAFPRPRPCGWRNWVSPIPDVRVRVLSVACFATLDSPQSESFLLMGLYDNDGYVKKAAANRLIALGKRAEALVLPIFDLDNAQAKFYSIQILALSARRDRLPGSSPFWTMRIPLRAALPRRPLPNSMRSRPFLRSPRPWNAWRRPRTRMRKWRKFGWKWQKGTWKSKPRRKAATEGESGTGPVLGP